jgi:hypothetical protein
MQSNTKKVEEMFAEQHVQNVFISLSQAANKICKVASVMAKKEGYQISLVVDRRILYKTVVSAYYDIARHKQFHFSGDHSKRSDGVKRAAYFTKWIVRFRPILCVFKDRVDDPEISNPWIMMLNEHLALEWSTFCVANDFSVGSFSIKEKFRNDLLYELHYREMNTDGLLAIYQMLSDTIRSGMQNPHCEFSSSI